jgi:phenylacetyl-CoA:acceptor oxidoreductase 26-kDa subunit
MSYGPNPWQQAHWDWRAAGNFICGGAGSGLAIFTVASGLQGIAARLLVLTSLALVGLGLLCVWLEIGRPLRAANVFINLRLSWMSREALASVFVFGCGLGLAAGVQACAVPLAVAALAFLYCQARIVQGARGIPAWREPITVPLLVACGLAEGAGLFWFLGAWQVPPSAVASVLFALLVAARWALWRGWRQRIGEGAMAPRALAHIDRIAPVVQWIGSALPIALALMAASGMAGDSWNQGLLAAAGLAVAITGARFKFTLITRAAFNQGFALARLPVRGVPR